MGEAASCANGYKAAGRPQNEMGEAASCADGSKAAGRPKNKMGEAASCANGNKAAGRPKKSAFTAVLNPGRGIDVLCEAQPVKLKCQNSKMVLQTYSYLPKG